MNIQIWRKKKCYIIISNNKTVSICIYNWTHQSKIPSFYLRLDQLHWVQYFALPIMQAWWVQFYTAFHTLWNVKHLPFSNGPRKVREGLDQIIHLLVFYRRNSLYVTRFSILKDGTFFLSGLVFHEPVDYYSIYAFLNLHSLWTSSYDSCSTL